MENQEQSLNSTQETPKDKGINEWNDRLDENLEPETTGDIDADERAKEYSDEHGSGDQSDENND